MKKSVLILFMVISLFAMNCSQPQKTEVLVATSDTEIKMEVEGMVCAVGCAKFIEKKVAALDGVSNCKVNFENGITQVSYASSQLTEEEIVEVINELNDGQYKVNSVEVKTLKEKSSSPRSKRKESSTEAEVSFNFPQLATYFISRLGR